MIPNWYELVLIVGGSYRLWRFAAKDVITQSFRDWLFRWEVLGTRQQDDYRLWLDKLVTCPWCLGGWVTIAVWGIWLIIPYAALVGCALLTAMLAVGMLAHFDEEE